MPSVLTTVLVVLLAGATAIGILTAANDNSQRVGSSQSDSVVLYGGR